VIKIEHNGAAVRARITALPIGLPANLTKAMMRVKSILHRHLVNEKLSQGGILTPRTGNTKRAVYSDSNATQAWVGIDTGLAPGARILNFGGIIRAKNAANLTIPLEAARTSNGVARFTARDVISNPFRFGFSGTFAAKGVIFGKLPGMIVPLFALKPQVSIEGRHFMETTLEDCKEQIDAEVHTAIQAALDAAKTSGGSSGSSGGRGPSYID
jgi:hypothetical protein